MPSRSSAPSTSPRCRPRRRGSSTPRSRRARWGSALLLAAPILLLATEALTAVAWSSPRYDYARDYISDLAVASRSLDGSPGSPLAVLMTAGLILCSALLAAGVLLMRLDALSTTFAIAAALGWTTVAAVPFSVETGAAGLEWVHVSATALGIAAGILLVFAAARTGTTLRPVLLPLAAIGGVCAIWFALDRDYEFAGAVERGALYPVLVAEAVIAVAALLQGRRR